MEFCTIDDDGNVDDRDLHASILGDELPPAEKGDDADEPGPGLSDEDEADISDLEDGEYDDLGEADPDADQED